MPSLSTAIRVADMQCCKFPVRKLSMARVLLSCILMLYAFNAGAADVSCADQVTEKKLAGAAKTSFMTKCERDAKTKCEADAAEKKLAGAAKTSFTNKCVKDAVGE
jgi:hypothetical protein